MVASRSPQAGLAAALAHDPSAAADTNAGEMSRVLQRVRTAAVAGAGKDDSDGRFQRGEAVGFVEEELRAWGDPAATLAKIMQELAGGDVELMTCIEGKDAPLDEARVAALGPQHVEVEYSFGGQENWWWLLSAE